MSSELEELKKRVAELESQVNPKPFKSDWKGPIDYTASATMPASALKAMVDAVPEGVMQGIRADAMKPNPVTEASSSTVRGTPSALPQRRNTGGWQDEVPLGPQAGIEHVDRLVDAQDVKDRAELIERELKLAKVRMGKGDAG